MNRERVASALGWIVLATCGVVCGAGLWRVRPAFEAHPLLLPALACAAFVTQHLAGLSPRPLPRLAATFVLVAALLAPPPAALAVVLCAGLAWPAALAGPRRAGIPELASSAAATLLVEVGARRLVPHPLDPRAAATLVLLVVGLFALQLTTHGLARLFRRRDVAAPPGTLLLELSAAPLAWLIAAEARAGASGHATVAVAMVIAFQAFLLHQARRAVEVREARGALRSRQSEIDALHSLGREILTTLDPSRVCSIVERECVKMFGADDCSVMLASPGEAQPRFLAAEPRAERELAGSWVRWIVDEKRGLLAGTGSAAARELQSDLAGQGFASGIVVPLLVGERVTGLLRVRARAAELYAEHHLALLTTVAQQSAVALENARNYTMATVDSLTGFYLRDHFFGRLDEEYRRAARYGGAFSLLMIDLDGFKVINDRHGHAAGDLYLHAVAATIRDRLRGADLPCRYGGDEFCILLPETDASGAQAIAERIRSAVAETVVACGGQTLRATASIGLAAYPDHDRGGVAALLRNADEALYRAKRAGRDRVVPFAA